MKVIFTEKTSNFIKTLDPKVQAKIRRRTLVLIEFGHMLRMPYSRYISPGIFELRTVGKDNIRLIYTFHDDVALVFYAFIKKTESINSKEMNTIKLLYNQLHS